MTPIQIAFLDAVARGETTFRYGVFTYNTKEFAQDWLAAELRKDMGR